jgi:hypothetical protein
MNGSRLRLVALLGVTALAAPALAQSSGLVGCYKVKDRAPHRAFTVTVTNAGVTQSCRVKAPARLGCLGTQISGVSPNPPGAPSLGAAGDVLCYPIRCFRPFPPAAQKTDEFGGQRLVTFRRAQLLCAPTAGASSTTTTTGPATSTPSTTTTTTTAAPQSCEFHDGRCEGTCANGGHCSAVTSGGACQCRRTACGDADAPACEGFCAPDEACVLDLSLTGGCHCVSIP